MFKDIMKKIFIAAGVSILVIFLATKNTTINDWQFYFLKSIVPEIKKVEEVEKEKISESKIQTPPPISVQPAKKEASTSQEILLSVPFTTQAPFAEWSDPRQQDGCEEASMLMAVYWARGEKLTKESAKKEILAIAEFEKLIYGSFVDTDVMDTVARIARGYFKFENARAVENITLDDIKKELFKGNLVLVPTNGQRLGNPNYKAPGPERHMLVIRGYNSAKKEFITNDAGTRKGEGYRYNEDVLFKAIVNYPTGDHVPIKEETKAMIIVWL
jgi:hypothetical protein